MIWFVLLFGLIFMVCSVGLILITMYVMENWTTQSIFKGIMMYSGVAVFVFIFIYILFSK